MKTWREVKAEAEEGGWRSRWEERRRDFFFFFLKKTTTTEGTMQRCSRKNASDVKGQKNTTYRRKSNRNMSKYSLLIDTRKEKGTKHQMEVQTRCGGAWIKGFDGV